jgi:hypothetical protein
MVVVPATLLPCPPVIGMAPSPAPHTAGIPAGSGAADVGGTALVGDVVTVGLTVVVGGCVASAVGQYWSTSAVASPALG